MSHTEMRNGGTSGQHWFRTTQEAVVEELRYRILAGTIEPGTRVLQSELATELGVSTTPIREALRQLVDEKLLDSDPHRGAVVHTRSREELEVLYQIRQELEPLEIAYTVKQVSDSEIQRAAELINDIEAADPGTYIRLNGEFHRLLSEASCQPLLSSLTGNLRTLSAFYTASTLWANKTAFQSTKLSPDHRRLVEACRSRDAKAARAIQIAHLKSWYLIAETCV